MGNMGKFDVDGLKKLQEQLNKIKDNNPEKFIEDCAKELAARLLAKVIGRTRPGDYSKEVKVVAKRNGKKHRKGETYTKQVNPSGKLGGTLRRGWTSKTYEEAQNGQGKKTATTEQAMSFVNTLSIQHTGNMFTIIVKNPVEYASYVEYGHRTRNHKGWVQGRFMLTISEQEIQQIAPMVLEEKMKKFLGECFK